MSTFNDRVFKVPAGGGAKWLESCLVQLRGKQGDVIITRKINAPEIFIFRKRFLPGDMLLSTNYNRNELKFQVQRVYYGLKALICHNIQVDRIPKYLFDMNKAENYLRNLRYCPTDWREQIAEKILKMTNEERANSEIWEKLGTIPTEFYSRRSKEMREAALKKNFEEEVKLRKFCIRCASSRTLNKPTFLTSIVQLVGLSI